MTDIATLGLAVDSRQVTQATTALSGLAAAAKPAAAAATALTAATHGTADAHTHLSTQSMAAFHSMRSMTEGFLAGQPVTQMLAQQMNHLSYAASGPGGLIGSFKQAGGALLGLLNPTTAVIAGLAAVAAGGYLAYSSVATMAKDFDDTARSAGTTANALHGLGEAAAFKGIGEPDFLKAMDRFAGSVYDAQHGLGGLAETFRANNKSAATFTDFLEKAADLIKNASSDQQRLQMLQQMGLPATMDWVRYLSQGAEGIKAAVAQATKFGESAEAQMVAKARAFDEAWDRSAKNLKTGFQSAVVDVAGWLDSLSSKGTALLMKLPGIGANVPTNILRMAAQDGGTGSRLSAASDVSGLYKNTPWTDKNTPKPVVDKAKLQERIAIEQQHIGLLGQTATAGDAVRQVELSVAAARLNGVSITNSQVDTLKRLAAEQSLGITAIKASTDAQRTDAEMVGMSVGKAAEYAAAQNAINDARRNGRPLTADNIAQIQQEASALGQAAQHADDMKWAYNNLVNGPMQTFRSALSSGATFFDAFKKAGVSALDSISTKLMDMAAQNLWKAAFPSGSSGGGILGLLGLGGGSAGSGAVMGSMDVGGMSFPAFGAHSGMGPGDAPTFVRNVPASTFDNAPRFHSGIGPGEKAAIITNDESVLTPGQMKAMGSAGAGITINNYNTFNGADPNSEARLRSYVDQSSKQSVQQALQQTAATKETTPGFMRSAR